MVAPANLALGLVPGVLIAASTLSTPLLEQDEAPPAASLEAGRDAERGETTAGFGFAVTGVGDWDRDGIPDAAASAPALGEDLPGAVWVFSGKTGDELARFVGDPGTDFGYALAGGMDVDGDSVGDLAVGVRAAGAGGVRRGEVRFYSGRTRAALAQKLVGPRDNMQFGAALAVVDDLDEDGERDLLVGAPGADRNAGAVQVYSGRSMVLLHTLRGRRPGARFGAAVASAGDVNGDGRGDFIVGSPNESGAQADTGAIRVFNGRTFRELRTMWGRTAHERFGTRVAALGDVTGDGRAEYAVASPAAELRGKPDVGRVQVFDGETGELRFEVEGTTAGAFFGRGLAGELDADGDGWPDLVVGAPYAVAKVGRLERRVGALRTFSGIDGRLLQEVHGEERGELLGWSVSVLSDPRDAGLRVGVVAGGPGRRETPPQPGDPPTRQGRLRMFTVTPD